MMDGNTKIKFVEHKRLMLSHCNTGPNGGKFRLWPYGVKITPYILVDDTDHSDQQNTYDPKMQLVFPSERLKIAYQATRCHRLEVHNLAAPLLHLVLNE